MEKTRVVGVQFIYPSLYDGMVLRENAVGSYRNGMKRAKEYLRDGYAWVIVRFKVSTSRSNGALYFYRQQAYKKLNKRGNLVQYMAQDNYDWAKLFNSEDMQ